MSNPNVEPLAQDFVVAARVPDHTRFFFHDPNLGRLSDGTLLIAAPQWPRRGVRADHALRIARSDDRGGSWQELDPLPYQEGIPFELDGRLLMFVQEKSHRNIQIVASNDRGASWSEPSTVLEGPLWNISTARVVRRRPHVLGRRLRSSGGAGARRQDHADLRPQQARLSTRRPVEPVQRRRAAPDACGADAKPLPPREEGGVVPLL